MSVATVAGPLIGGVIVDTSWLGWRWCFFVGAPAAGLLTLPMIIGSAAVASPTIVAVPPRRSGEPRGMPFGPVVIGFDGSPAALRALQEAAELLAPRPGLVVVVWEAGTAYDFATIPSAGLDLPPAQFDLRSAAELDQALYNDASELARHGAAIATSLGMPAEGLAVADELTVGETLVRVAGDVAAAAVVVGRHEHSALHDVLLGSTARHLIRHAPCPVLVVRHVKNGD
jgi:nucleotide-binding universal stress UspA family protein